MLKLRTTLEGHSGPVLCVRFDREGRRIASGSRDRTIKIWSLRGKLERTLEAHGKAVDVLCFTADNELISAGGDGCMTIWSWPKGVPRLEIEAHKGPIYTLGVSRDGRLIASGGADETIGLWSSEDGELVHRLAVGRRGMAFVFAADGEHLVTGARGDTLRFWSLETGELVSEQGAGPGMVGAFEPGSGDWAVSRGWRGPVTVWSTESWSYASVLPIVEDGLCGAMLRPGREQIVCAWDKHVGVFDALDGRLLGEADTISKHVHELDVSPDGRLVAVACGDKRVRIWDLAESAARG